MLRGTADPMLVRELETIEQQLAATWKARDCAGWSALLADDWTVTHVDAQIISKQEALEMCRTMPRGGSIVDEVAVRVYGDTAVVTGRTVASISDELTIRLRFTDVFVHRNERWLAVASHATRIADEPVLRP
jgi:ketosteroid isomerase-like protein